MTLEGKKIVVFAERMYQELELWYPVLRMREEGATVSVVGPEKDATYNSERGYPVKTDLSPAEVDVANIDAVIVPGGYAPDLMRRNNGLVGLVREAFESGKIVATICHAGWMLASAGIARGRKVTCVTSIKDDLINAGATYVDQPVVRDGNIITSRVPSDLPAFCREIISALAGD